MFKNASKEEKLIFKASVRPFIIFCLSVLIVVIINSIFGKLSQDTINGYICCMILNMFITYCNLCHIQVEDRIENTEFDMKNIKEEE